MGSPRNTTSFPEPTWWNGDPEPNYDDDEPLDEEEEYWAEADMNCQMMPDGQCLLVFTRTPMGQLLYDLCFTDLTPRYLARKHKLPAHEIRELRMNARKAMLGKRKLTKAQRERAVESAAALNRALDHVHT